MPEITINSNIDGNNKTISNWYSTDHDIVIMNGNGRVHDLILSNIYCPNRTFVRFNGNNDNYHFVNCKLRGIVGAIWMAIDDYGSTHNFSSCSFNLKANSATDNQWSYVGVRYCRFKFTVDSPATSFVPSCKYWNNEFDSCYIDIPCKIGNSGEKYINCVCDLTTNDTFTIGGDSSKAKSIINSTHAPNATADSNGNFALVSDSNWLNTSYLRSVGFNAG